VSQGPFNACAAAAVVLAASRRRPWQRARTRQRALAWLGPKRLRKVTDVRGMPRQRLTRRWHSCPHGPRRRRVQDANVRASGMWSIL